MKIELSTAVSKADEMRQKGIASHKILAHLVLTAEKLNGNESVSSILVLDKEGLLRNGASPGLPHDYLTAIDGLKPNPRIGTCAAAAATGDMIITKDFRDDHKWAELKHLPLSLGFICAWSLPIKNQQGKVLGTFGTYYRDVREPINSEIEVVTQLASAAAQVLEPQE